MNLFGTPLSLPNFGLKKAIYSIMDDAKAAEQTRRAHGRVPFFQPAFINLDKKETFSVFTRDISPDGMGLLHNMPIEPQIVNLAVHCSNGTIVELRLDLDWCLSCGEGWYISGGGFMGSNPLSSLDGMDPNAL